ncbi:MAG TPA: YciI family protein [Candidatus Dormibacteraeota bacterium]
MKYVLLYETGDLAKAKEHFPAHQARFQRYHADGTLLMLGPYADPADGAMSIFTTREAAEEFARGDPFVLNGVVSRWEVREWNEALAP